MKGVKINKITGLTQAETDLVEEYPLMFVEADLSSLTLNEVKTLLSWLDYETQGETIYITPYVKNTARIYFSNKDDALMFKLVWG